MTLRECIDQVDKMKPNQYTEEDKIRWISEVEHSVFYDIIVTHRRPWWRHKKDEMVRYSPYTTEDMDKELIAPFPYDSLYTAYLKMKIDEENQETQRYNASATLFNAYLDEFAKHINKTRMPVGRNAYHIY